MTDRGPNGIPYLDPDRSEFGQWESLETGEDGESLDEFFERIG